MGYYESSWLSLVRRCNSPWLNSYWHNIFCQDQFSTNTCKNKLTKSPNRPKLRCTGNHSVKKKLMIKLMSGCQ
ncbi:unnamed protein product, partial [Vitis vinifera]